ncbi:MAG TPA: replication protein C, IncQ-type [Pyrinomonadaceae bacterium]|nr:replication protein C, IncQ-type [Pyrinomonadaceae bacterium]
MSLFTLLENDRDDYSHTIELYDFLPKFVFGKPERISGKFLETIERDFVCRKNNYRLRMTPARIKDANGTERDTFPGKREEMVEDALRKMAADGRSAKAVYLNGQLSVVFSRFALQKELEEHGHSYDYRQIEEAIITLFSVSIEVTREDEDITVAFHPIEAYGFKGRDEESVTFVKFSPLVTESIQKNAFRLVNYQQLMSYKTTIARLLHKRMSHNFSQAAKNEVYHISTNTIYRDFGLKKLSNLGLQVIEIKKALEELIEANVVLSYEVKEVFDSKRKNKKIDCVFQIKHHQSFIDEAINSNKDVNMRKFTPEVRGKSFRQTKNRCFPKKKIVD